MTREYAVCYAFGRRRAPLAPLGPEETMFKRHDSVGGENLQPVLQPVRGSGAGRF